MDIALIKKAHQVLQPVIGEVPEFLYGVELMEHIYKAVQNLDESQRRSLRMLIRSFISHLAEKEASDIDIGSAGSHGNVWFRIHGNKSAEPEAGFYSEFEMDVIILNLLIGNQFKLLMEHRNLDFSFSVVLPEGKVRLRGNIYFEMGHLALNFRQVAAEIRQIASYDFHPKVLQLLSLKYVKRGLGLITGITGAGKSTTLDAIIDMNNRTIDGHVTIIGSPIEQIHQSKRCIVRHREIGADVLTFREGAIQALRQDPDIIIIGEMRDPETMITVLEVTDSGHMVFSTLHTSSAVESIDRIIGEVPPQEQNRVRDRLADVLTLVISQKLPRTLDGKRILAKEVLVVTPSVRAAIKNNNLDEIYQMIQQSNSMGMFTMEQDLKRLYEERKISYEEALSHANEKKRFKEIVKYSV
jgi:twitching motility protein PilT